MRRAVDDGVHGGPDPVALIDEFIELAEAAVEAASLEEYSDRLLLGVAHVAEARSTFLYVEDPRLPSPYLRSHGLPPGARARLEASCCAALRGSPGDAGLWAEVIEEPGVPPIVYTLGEQCAPIGLLGMTARRDAVSTEMDALESLCHVVARTLDHLVEQLDTAKHMAHLNAYQTVSSMLAEPLGLHDLIEATLFSCMDVVSAEAASVLLLDDAKENFRFYAVEGPAAPVLAGTTFSAAKGIAGWCLETQESAIIDDAASDPRFYHGIDEQTSFHTGNLVVVPLTAGEEPVGVLEVLNKSGGERFTEDERSLLMLVAQQIALAVRNAKVFEYVADTYCKQRQGEHSCRGCSRPLGAWTPCVRYREKEL